MRLWEQFADITERHFHYLESEFGFSEVSREYPFVKYGNPLIMIAVYYQGEPSYELDLGIQELARPERPSYGIDMLSELHGDTREEYRSPSTAESLEQEVKELAQTLRSHGDKLLSGDMSDLRALDELERLAIERDFGKQEEK